VHLEQVALIVPTYVARAAGLAEEDAVRGTERENSRRRCPARLVRSSSTLDMALRPGLGSVV
jgi:hypothetical protein